jgi:ABC-type dipeptide/oligopeptide/nickel transport system ATPase component
VLIAGAIAPGPDLLIADEPTAALDVTVQAQILDLLGRLQRDLGMALLLITHDLGVVAQTADLVHVMRGGRIVESAETHALFASPQHPYTQAIVTQARRLGHWAE